MKRISLYILLLSICVIAFIAIFFCCDNHIKHNLIACGHLEDNPNGDYVYYEMINDQDVKDIYSFSGDLPEYGYDFQDHSYIILFGYELEDISYSRISKPLFHDYHFYVPKVYLNDRKTNQCYIYELPKVNIDVDPDDYKRNIYFVDM